MAWCCISLGAHWYTLRKVENRFDRVDSVGNNGAGSIEALAFDTGIMECWKTVSTGHRAMVIYTNIPPDVWPNCIATLKAPTTYVELHENLWSEEKCIRPNRDPCECPCPCVVGECANSCGLVECAPSCHWGDQCGNQRVHRRDFAKTHVEKVGFKGFGLFTSARVGVGAVVGVYFGEVCHKRNARKRAKESRGEYLLAMQVGADMYYVDAEALGTSMRFVNHSCNPNTQWRVWEVGREPMLVLETLYSIQENEEVTVNYGRDYWIPPGLPKDGGFHCLCGCESMPSAILLSSDEEVKVLTICKMLTMLRLLPRRSHVDRRRKRMQLSPRMQL